tara:strand:+ start:2034 stop:3125 length:1092 start_codon:yes stop_codon:yes gene_type:complete
MAHEIEEIDKTFALAEDGTWHNKHIVPDGNVIHPRPVDEDHAHILFQPEIVSPFMQNADGSFSPVENTKIITRMIDGKRIPLGVASDRYHSVGNDAVIMALTGALEREGLPYTIRTMGTLKGCKLFYASLTVDNEEERLINGDRFRMYLNVVSSHDGSVTVTIYDSNMRIVCANTFRASQKSGIAGDVKVKVRHTRNASLALDGASSAIASMFAGRDVFVTLLNRLASVGCDRDRAEQLITAWQSVDMSVHDLMSTRAFNTTLGIADLFQTGKGNRGENLYDLFNGVTEYYTSGTGTGKDDGTDGKAWKKLFSSEFGTGADKKATFLDYLINILDDNTLEEEAKKGELILADKKEDLVEKNLI